MIVLALAACGPSVDCTAADAVLAEVDGQVLACGDGQDVVDWLEVLGGRPLPAHGDRDLVLAQVAERYRRDPAGTVAWIGRIRQEGGLLANALGLDGAELRSHLVWQSDHGEGPVTPDDGKLWNLQQRALSVWTRDDGEQLAMTESDLEGWIRYASLCREAQGGGVLRISVADRVTVYQELIDRFDTAGRAEQIALASFGHTWPQVIDAWADASYERQQAWIRNAPLPPPMTATSLAYAEAVFQGDVGGHAAALQDVLGPFSVDPKGRFGVKPPLIVPRPILDPSPPREGAAAVPAEGSP